MKDNVPDGASFVTSYGNNDYYTGASAYQGNIDLRPGSARNQSSTYDDMTDDEIVALMKERFEKEVCPGVLGVLYPNLAPVGDFEPTVTIHFYSYNGSSAPSYARQSRKVNSNLCPATGIQRPNKRIPLNKISPPLMKVTGIYFCRAVSLLSDRNERTGRVSRDLGSILRLGVCHSEGIITRAVGIAVISDHMCAFGKERNEEIGSLITDFTIEPYAVALCVSR